MSGKGLKQQSALELLTTYSWALLIIAVFVAAVAVINSARPATNYLASSCSIEPLLPCTQTLLTYNTISPIRFTLLFTNNLGQTMYFPANSLNITVTNIGTKGITYNTGNCTPALALQGTPVLCTALISGTFKPPVGTQETILFSLNYQLCNGKTKASCASAQYKSAGQSSQTMAPSSILFHTLVIQTNPTSGLVNLNGVTYLNGANVLLLTNQYSAYAIPPSGYKFTLWGVSGGSGLSSTVTPNTILNFSSNGTVTASFNSIGPTSTVTLTSTSTSTTASSSTSISLTVPGAPTGLTANAISSNQINLVWVTPASNGGATITGYEIDRSLNGGTSWSVLVANTGSSGVTYSDTGLTAATTYTYRVEAINSVGTGAASNTASATTSASVPGAPTGLTANTISYNQINLAWTAPASNGGAAITGYEIDRSLNGGGSWSILVANTLSTAVAYSDNGLTPGTTYTYRVDAINSVGVGASSNTASATTQVAYVPITLTNSGSSTPANYQQLVSVNSNTYSTYINSAWSNVEFTTGAAATGTVLQAWIQTNATNTATKTIVWVKIPAGVASGTSTIYMNFLSSNVLSVSGPTGEAPELSGTYGQYDDGGTVFALYDSFNGVTLNSSKWTTYTINNMGSAPSQVVVNNELQLNHGSTWWGSDAYSTSSFSTTSGWALDYQFDWASQSSVGNCGGVSCDTPADVYLRYTGSGRDTTYYGEPGCPDVDVLVNIHNGVTTLTSCGGSAVTATASISPTVGVWYPSSLQFIPTSGTTGNAYFYYNGAGSPTISVSITSSSYYPTTPVVAEFHDGNYASNDEFWIRDARLRVAVATPPTTSFGAVA